MTRELILLALLYASGTYSFQQGYRFTGLRLRSMLETPTNVATASSCSTLHMSTVAEVVESTTTEQSTPNTKAGKGSKSTKPYVDYTAFAIGQEHSGTISNVQNFGVFVHIEAGCDVLLPRSQLTKTQFEKLSSLHEAKSQEPVKVSLIGVSVEKRTISGKLVAPNTYKARTDLKSVQEKVTEGKVYDGKVVAVHDFGVFVELEGFGEESVQGLLPNSKIPKGESFKEGATLKVKVEELNVDKQRLTLGLPQGAKSEEVSMDFLASLPKGEWLPSMITRVTSFGVYVRPAGYDSSVLLHSSRLPRDLITSLRKRLNLPVQAGAASSLPSIEGVLNKGDVVKVRVEATTIANRPFQVSMLPVKRVNTSPSPVTRSSNSNSNAGEEAHTSPAEAVVTPEGETEAVPAGEEAVEGEAAEGQAEGETTLPHASSDAALKLDPTTMKQLEEMEKDARMSRKKGGKKNEEQGERYDAHSLLLWWRGAKYEKPSRKAKTEATITPPVTYDQVVAGQVVWEDDVMRSGRWRRLFEADMSKETSGKSDRSVRKEQELLEEEIGEMEGIVESEFEDVWHLGAGPKAKIEQSWDSLAKNIDLSFLPDDWKNELTFLQEIEETEKELSKKVRTGKNGDSQDFDRLLRDIEQEMASKAARGGAGGGGRGKM
eukprot:gene31896-38564_t